MALNQFKRSNVNISLLAKGERYSCSQCKLNFVQQESYDFYRMGAVIEDEDDLPKVYCPICTSCHLRFFPALQALEDLAENGHPYSLVTVLDSELQSTISNLHMMRSCITASTISRELDAANTVMLNASDGRNTKITLTEDIRREYLGHVTFYKRFSLLLASQQYGTDSDPKIPKTYHVPEQHRQLGMAVCDRALITDSISDTCIDNIIVVPSIEHISNLISSNVYSKDEISAFAQTPIFGE